MTLSINNKLRFWPVALIVMQLACYCYSYGQSQISGKIISNSGKAPVPNANVFLNNATVGGRTAGDGSFVLKNVKAGKYELIVSIIGYEIYRQTVIAATADIKLPDITIFPKVIALREVTIKPVNDAERNRNYQWFKEQFLGSSGMAQNCVIKNPEALDLYFNDTTAVLAASCADFLQIENPGLGYRLKYLLTDFSYNTQGTHALHYEGSVLFENMKGTASQEARWVKRRLAVYQPSQMHFLRSLLNYRLDEEGFRVLQCLTYQNPERPAERIVDQKVSHFRNQKSFNTKTRDSLAYWEKKQRLPKMLLKLMGYPMSPDEILKVTDQKNIYALGCDMDALHITYNRNRHFPKKATLNDLDNPYNRETTLLHFNKLYAFFYKSGGLVDVNSVSYTGGWGNNRVAELLPVDYEPSVTEEIEKRDVRLNAVTVVQPGPLKDSLLTITAASDSSIKNHPAEKIYVQLDKPYYATGDTIWFKGYLVNASTLALSTTSGILHVDIANDSNTYTRQYKYEIKDGLSWGNIGLDKFPAGNYTIRAYTNWMRNFDDAGFFYKQFAITDGKDQTWMANEQIVTSIANGLLNTRVKLQLRDINKTPLGDKDLQLEVMTGNRHLYKQQMRTDKTGMLDVNFAVPEKAANLKLIATDKQGANKITIPVNLNRADKVDIQFLPEGGSLVAGLPARVGFKAIGEDGNGVNLSGIIVDGNKQQLASFQTLHNGMGSFDMAVKPGENYTAEVNLPGGLVKTYPLPALKSSGTRLNVTNPAEKDSVTVSVAVTKDLAQSGTNYFLIGKARGVICYAAIINFKEGGKIRRSIAKNLFPTGIIHFILMTTNGQPLNERLVYVDHDDDLHIDVEPDQSVYVPKDSIALRFRVRDRDGEPVAGNFSMAVTEDNLVKTDSASNNILTHLLLTSDLKGYLEEPLYYFQKHANSWQALDNLLLTQGWVNYDWDVSPDKPKFDAENGLIVKGRVSNVLNQSLKGTHVTLLSKSPMLVKDTTTDNEGGFIFNNFPRIDTPAIVLKAVNRNGKNFNVDIKIDELSSPIFDTRFPSKTLWYVNGDSILINYNKNRGYFNNQVDYLPGGHRLKEVKIVARKLLKDSKNLNGPGNADVVLDEKDLELAGKKSWLQLLKESVKGFREGMLFLSLNYLTPISDKIRTDRGLFATVTHRYSNINQTWYFVGGQPVKFYIDGIFIFDYPNILPYIIPSSYSVFPDIDGYLKSYNAEDIKGIEVMSSPKYLGRYGTYSIAAIEITTRSGKGPLLRSNPPGTYLYKPLAVSYPKDFYKPRYVVNDTTKHLPDLRSTIDWEPNIIMDAEGRATVHFYAADKASTYTVTIEGIDFNGNMGYKRQKISIRRQKQIGKSK